MNITTMNITTLSRTRMKFLQLVTLYRRRCICCKDSLSSVLESQNPKLFSALCAATRNKLLSI
uniref:Uncharacterized protein n=1 Tax=Romanomermis culicivorax TaxID=13658 RepID=A0A915JWF4_ROMCU